MFVLKLFSLVLPFQIALTLTAIEDKYLTNQLLEYFDDDYSESKGDVIAVSNQKRSADPTVDFEERFASLFSSFNLTSRANHYWTRKRGRERTTPPQMIWEIYYTLYPTQKPSVTVIIDEDESRKKRETMIKFLSINKISSRVKREVESDDENIEEVEKGENETLNVTEKNENQTREKGKWGKFGNKL